MIDDRHITRPSDDTSHLDASREQMGYAGLRMNADTFLAIGQTTEHYQLLDGVVVMSPSATGPHQHVLRLIQRQLESFIDDHPDHIYYPDVDVRLSNDTVYAPDISCYKPGRLQLGSMYPAVAPDLVIEILSAGTKSFDLTTKKQDYARFGVTEYMVVDSSPSVMRSLAFHYRLARKRYTPVKITGGKIKSAAWPGFVLDLKPIRTLLKSL